jgi:hypothetical protein
MVYDTVELIVYMFKEDPVTYLATACNLDNIKMTHRLMEGDKGRNENAQRH